MTDDDKALVEAMKDAVLHGKGFLKNGKHVPIDDVYLDPRDACIEALSAENERLREALKEVFEAWAGSEGFIPETAPEGYLLYLTKRMAHIASAALGEQQ